MRTRTVLGIVAVGAAVAAGCSSDPDAEPPSTTASTDEATTSPPPATTEAPPPTEQATTSSTTTSSTTLPPPTTTTPEQVKAEVVAAYLELEDKALDLFMSPSLDGLDARVAEIAVPDSPYFLELMGRVTTLVNNDQFVALNEPNLRSITVESVELVGEESVVESRVQVCQVSNALLIKGAATSPVPGSSIVVSGTGEVAAYRYTLSLRRTEVGWRHDGIADPNDPYWPGLAACPAA